MLTACGGSDSDTADNTGGTGNGDTVTLSASVVQPTVCNTTVAASTAELVVYDNNWAIKSRHKADSNGNISARIPKTELVNLSFIGTSGSGASRRISIDTFTQHPVGDIGVYTIPGVSNQGCECQTTTVAIISDVNTLTYGAQLSGHNVYTAAYYSGVSSNVVLFNNVEICRSTGGQWPVLYANTHRDEQFEAAGYLSEYNPADPLTLVLDQTPISYSANFDPSSTFSSVVHNFANAHISHSRVSPSANIQLFDDLPGLAAISLRANDSYTDYYDDVRVRVGRMQRHSVAPPYSTTLNVDLPQADGPLQLMQGVMNWLNSASTSYDLSAVSDFETFSIGLLTTLVDGSIYTQTFYGPKRGTIPDNPLPDDYGVEALLDEENISIFASMYRYGEQQTYQQYLQSKTAASKMPSNERLLGNRSQFNSIFIDINQ
tara:strand:- start:460202 stop:461497 length:1296 start_codon:yes stop_codon:yes gene_type:complete